MCGRFNIYVLGVLSVLGIVWSVYLAAYLAVWIGVAVGACATGLLVTAAVFEREWLAYYRPSPTKLKA